MVCPAFSLSSVFAHSYMLTYYYFLLTGNKRRKKPKRKVEIKLTSESHLQENETPRI